MGRHARSGTRAPRPPACLAPDGRRGASQSGSQSRGQRRCGRRVHRGQLRRDHADLAWSFGGSEATSARSIRRVRDGLHDRRVRRSVGRLSGPHRPRTGSRRPGARIVGRRSRSRSAGPGHRARCRDRRVGVVRLRSGRTRCRKRLVGRSVRAGHRASRRADQLAVVRSRRRALGRAVGHRRQSSIARRRDRRAEDPHGRGRGPARHDPVHSPG